MESIVFEEEQVTEVVYEGTFIIDERLTPNQQKRKIFNMMKRDNVPLLGNESEYEILYEGVEDNEGLSETQETKFVVRRTYMKKIPYRVTKDEVYQGTYILDRIRITPEEQRKKIFDMMRDEGYSVENEDEYEIGFEGVEDNEGLSDTQTTQFVVSRVKKERLSDEEYEALEQDQSKEAKDLYDRMVSLKKEIQRESNPERLQQLQDEVEDITGRVDTVVEKSIQNYGLFEEQLQQINEQIKALEESLQESAKEYETSYERMKALMENQEQYSEEDLEKAKAEENEKSVAIRKEIDKKRKELASLKSKKTTLQKDYDTAKSLGLSAEEYQEITSNLRKKSILNAILEAKGLGEIVSIPARERTPGQKKQLADAKKEIVAEIAKLQREDDRKTVLESIEALYGIELQRVQQKGRQRTIIVKKEAYEAMQQNAQKLPEKVMKTSDGPIDYKPGEVPKDLEDVFESKETPKVAVKTERDRIMRDFGIDIDKPMPGEEMAKMTPPDPAPPKKEEGLRDKIMRDFGIDIDKPMPGETMESKSVPVEETPKVDEDSLFADDIPMTSPIPTPTYIDPKEITTLIEVKEPPIPEPLATPDPITMKKKMERDAIMRDFGIDIDKPMPGEEMAKMTPPDPAPPKKEEGLRDKIMRDFGIDIDKPMPGEEMASRTIPIDQEPKVEEKQEEKEQELRGMFIPGEENIRDVILRDHGIDIDQDDSYEVGYEGVSDNDGISETQTTEYVLRKKNKDVLESSQVEEQVPIVEEHEEKQEEKKQEEKEDEERKDVKEKFTLFHDPENPSRMYARKPVFERFHLEPQGEEVRIEGTSSYGIKSEDAEYVESNAGNNYSPYVVEHKTSEIVRPKVEEVKEDQLDGRKDVKEKFTLFHDPENPSRMYARKPVFERFHLEPQGEEVRIEGTSSYGIKPEDAEYVESNANNNYSPYEVEHKTSEIVRPKVEEVKEDQLEDRKDVKEKFTIFHDIDDESKLYARKPVFERFHLEPQGEEVTIEGTSSYGIKPEDAEYVEANANNNYSPYVVEHKTAKVISKPRVDEETKSRGATDKITIFQDGDKYYVRKPVFERFHKQPIGPEIRIEGVVSYEIAKEDAEYIINNAKNNYSPYIISYVDVKVEDNKKDYEIVEENNNYLTPEEVAKYKAENINASDDFKIELKDGKVEYNIVRKTNGKAKAPDRFKQIVEEKVGEYQKQDDIPERITSDDAKKLVERLKTDKSNTYLYGKLREYGMKTLRQIDATLQQSYSNLGEIIAELKDIEEQSENLSRDDETIARLEEARKKCISRAADEIRGIEVKREESKKILSCGIDGLEKEFKDSINEFQFVGHHDGADLEGELLFVHNSFNKELTTSLMNQNEMGIVQNFLGRESCFSKNQEVQGKIIGKRSMGRKYTPMLEEFVGVKEYRKQSVQEELKKMMNEFNPQKAKEEASAALVR